MTSLEMGAMYQSWAWPTGMTKVLAVIGDPIDHSLSPILHNSAIRALGLDIVYVALRVPRDDIELAVAAMRAFGFQGCSVTMPHKERIIPFLDGLTDRAKILRSVNIVYKDGDKYIGDSNDGVALVRSLREDHGLAIRGKAISVIGSGGAGRAISLALAEAGAASVYVFSRNLQTAAEAAELADKAGFVGVGSDIETTDIVINATPVGMAGTSLAGLSPIPANYLREGQFVYDIIYHPSVTPLMEMANAKGISNAGGVGMLVHLAAIAFTNWTGHEAPMEDMRAAAKAEVLRRH